MIGFVVSWIAGIGVNIAGIIQPSLFSPFELAVEIDNDLLEASVYWYIGGLVFCIVACVCMNTTPLSLIS